MKIEAQVPHPIEHRLLTELRFRARYVALSTVVQFIEGLIGACSVTDPSVPYAEYLAAKEPVLKAFIEEIAMPEVTDQPRAKEALNATIDYFPEALGQVLPPWWEETTIEYEARIQKLSGEFMFKADLCRSLVLSESLQKCYYLEGRLEKLVEQLLIDSIIRRYAACILIPGPATVNQGLLADALRIIYTDPGFSDILNLCNWIAENIFGLRRACSIKTLDPSAMANEILFRVGKAPSTDRNSLTAQIPDICLYTKPRVTLGSQSFAQVTPRQSSQIVAKRDQDVRCWGGAMSCHSLRDARIEASMPSTLQDVELRTAKVNGRGGVLLKCGYQPSDKPSSEFLVSIRDSVELLHDTLHKTMRGKEVGLLAVCGETSAAKSQHILGLTYHRLRDKSPIFRAATDAIRALKSDLTQPDVRSALFTPPGYSYAHLLALEQPLEDPLFYMDDGEREPLNPSLTAALGVHYTPRNLLSDFTAQDDRERMFRKEMTPLTPLQKALELDALRQRPTVVLVGESRNEDDLAEVVRFAATGHQIFTTFHSGSLQEGLGRILSAWKAKSASDRGEIASRIFSVIHLRTGTIRGKKLCLPSIWTGTERALDGLVKDGLRSVIPQRSPRASGDSATLGRLFFADQLIKHGNIPPELKEEVLQLAIKWDLEER